MIIIKSKKKKFEGNLKNIIEIKDYILLTESNKYQIPYDLYDLKLYDPFLWMGFNCLKATEPLQGGSLLFITKFPEISATPLFDLGRMKG